jgi:hypothetical protein
MHLTRLHISSAPYRCLLAYFMLCHLMSSVCERGVCKNSIDNSVSLFVGCLHRAQGIPESGFDGADFDSSMLTSQL